MSKIKVLWEVAPRPWASNVVIFGVKLSSVLGLLDPEDIELISFETSMLSQQPTVALQNT
jgi:hypothetical protein